MLNDHVQNPNRNNSQKNLYTFGRAEFTTNRAKMLSPWKQSLQKSINDIRGNI